MRGNRKRSSPAEQTCPIFKMCASPAASLELSVCSANIGHCGTVADANDAQNLPVHVQGRQGTLMRSGFFLKQQGQDNASRTARPPCPPTAVITATPCTTIPAGSGSA